MKISRRIAMSVVPVLFALSAGCTPESIDEEIEETEETETASEALVSLPSFFKSALGSGICLDIAGGNAASGTQVQIWGCNGSAAQKWSVSPAGELKSALGSNLCLDVSGSNTANG